MDCKMKKMMTAVIITLAVLSGCTPNSILEKDNSVHPQAAISQETSDTNVTVSARAEPDNSDTLSQETVNATVTHPIAHIGEAKAKGIALSHAGLKEADVVFARVHLDYDDGRREYEVEFYSGNIEYDYDIDAISGEIRSYDHDAEYYSDPQTAPNPAGSTDIGEAKAKDIALSHAGYTASDVHGLRTERNYDHGRLEYEVEFYVGNIEYSYEIDAAGGAVLNYEAEQDD
jgi:uncharacterized membrane protein YkoI